MTCLVAAPPRCVSVVNSSWVLACGNFKFRHQANGSSFPSLKRQSAASKLAGKKSGVGAGLVPALQSVAPYAISGMCNGRLTRSWGALSTAESRDRPSSTQPCIRSEAVECVQLAAAFPPASLLAGIPSFHIESGRRGEPIAAFMPKTRAASHSVVAWRDGGPPRRPIHCALCKPVN